MKINERGREIVKSFEGLRLKAFERSPGVWAIGYGHTGDVKPTHRITEHQAEAILDVDLDRLERAVARIAHRVTENQFSALVSLAFDVGLPELELSRLLVLHNWGRHDLAAAQFTDGAALCGPTASPATVRRRLAERVLYEASC